MDLQTYLTKSSSRSNRQILQSLGATEEQIEYIMETPGNFNWNVWDGFGSGGITLPYTFHFEMKEIEYEGKNI